MWLNFYASRHMLGSGRITMSNGRGESLARQVDVDNAITKMNLIKSRVLAGRMHEKKLEEK